MMIWVVAIVITYFVIRRNLTAGLLVGAIAIFGAYKTVGILSVGGKVFEQVQATHVLVEEKWPRNPKVENARTQLPGMLSLALNNAPVDLNTNLHEAVSRQSNSKKEMDVAWELGGLIAAVSIAYEDEELGDRVTRMYGENGLLSLTTGQLINALQARH